MDEIPTTECIDLLRHHAVGRLCVICDGTPIALPTSYRLVADTGGTAIVMRTRPDGVVSRSLGPAGFEIDEIDLTRGVAWSVLAQGELRALAGAPGDVALQPWVSGRSAWVTLAVRAVTGRRIAKDGAFAPVGRPAGFEVDWAV